MMMMMMMMMVVVVVVVIITSNIAFVIVPLLRSQLFKSSLSMHGPQPLGNRLPSAVLFCVAEVQHVNRKSGLFGPTMLLTGHEGEAGEGSLVSF